MKFKLPNGQEIYLNGYLTSALDTLIHNVSKDWDFIIIITGDRMVRIGKSVLAQAIAAYLAWRLKTEWGLDHIFFDSEAMIDAAQRFPKNSVLVYDEARESLAISKTYMRVQQDIIDFFTECGQLNHIFILVLPDFFELKEPVAVGRSELLINVYRKEVDTMIDMYNDGKKIPVVRYDRGQFEFFNRKTKAKLYDISKSTGRKTYGLVEAGFLGDFGDFYTVDKAEYIKKKAESLSRFRERQAEKRSKTDIIRDKLVMRMLSMGLTHKKIVEQFAEEYEYDMALKTVYNIIKRSSGVKDEQL